MKSFTALQFVSRCKMVPNVADRDETFACVHLVTTWYLEKDGEKNMASTFVE